LATSWDANVVVDTVVLLVDYPQFAGNAEDAYTAMSNALIAAASNNVLTDLIVTNANANGATGLDNVQATGAAVTDPVVVIPPTAAPTLTPSALPTAPSTLAPTVLPTGEQKSDSNDKDLSDGEIAGIVIGSVVGFVLLVALLWAVFLRGETVSAHRKEVVHISVTDSAAHRDGPVVSRQEDKGGLKVEYQKDNQQLTTTGNQQKQELDMLV
jgi:predicted lactoylglutathione lyase